MQLTSDALADVFTVPQSDWTAISKRVSLVILAEAIAGEIAQALPEFPKLLGVCRSWKATTFPGLVEQSRALADYAGEALIRFTALQGDVAGLDPNREPPAAVRATALVALSKLAQHSAALQNAFEPLSDALAVFTTENEVVDAQVGTYAARLGPDWQSITAPSAALDQAIGRVKGTWLAIASDLNRVVQGQIDITTAFLLGLELQVALNTWSGLRREASAFAALSADQERILSGAWLGTAARLRKGGSFDAQAS